MDEILRGIKACYHEIDGKNEFTVVPDVVLYLLSGKKHRFVLENNPNLIGEKTTNPQTTVNEAKWAFILSYLYPEALKTPEGEKLPLWADLGGGKVKVKQLGIADQYKQGSFIEITPNSNDVWLGNYHRMEVFSHIPGKGLNFHFLTIDKPKIYLAYFDKQNVDPEIKEFKINDGYYSYGEVIKFHVATHMLPLKISDQYKQKYGKIENEPSFEDLEVEIHLTDENHKVLQEDPIVKGKLVDYSPTVKEADGVHINLGTANISYEFPIFINPEWKDTIHTKDKKVKAYSVNIKITNTKTKKEYTYQPDQSQIRQIAKSKRDFNDVEVSPVFWVKYEAMETVLARMEQKKANMIQYIGDIDYSFKEKNPCAYSKITINDGETDYEIFNEYSGEKVKDSTKRWIDIVAGDKEAKDIKITAKYLQNKDASPENVRTAKNGYMCQKILNDDQPHNGIRDVFKMDWIVGQYRPSQDPRLFMQRIINFAKSPTPGTPLVFHPSNSDKAPKLTSQNIPTDQEMKGTPQPKEIQEAFKGISVSGIQGLQEGTDFTIDEGNDSITLKLKYQYNKSYDHKIANYLYGKQEYLSEGLLNDNFKNVWVVRYLLKFIKKEQIHQTYFVPVTTCRYPNQIAGVRVFPDMKWVINLNYNIETPLYYNATTPLEEYYSGFNEGKINTQNNNTRKDILDKKIANHLQHYVGRKTSFGLYVECEVSGEDDVIKLGGEFAEKFRNMFGPLFWMVNKIDGDLGVSDARSENTRLQASPATQKGLMARLKTLPMSFELNPPSLGVGLGIGYAVSKSGSQTFELEGRLVADPIIGAKVKLDILALGSKFKPWGAIIDALDLVSWLANLFSGGRVEINYELYFELSAAITLVGADSKDGESTPANIKYNFADEKFSGSIALQGELKGVLHASFSLKIYVKTEKNKSFDAEANKKKSLGAGIGAEASTSVTLTLGKNFGKNNDWDADFYFAGVTLKVWAEAGYSDKSDAKTVKLIPDYEDKINIFKNKGEIK